MIITETKISGVFLIDVEKMEDERGFFARNYCADEFQAAGIEFVPVQANVSWNKSLGTLRGMHYQIPPFEEDKLVRCSRGRIYDVAVDLRENSPTYKRWFGAELSEENGRSLLIPKGCAHGFLTRADDTEVSYLMGSRYIRDSGAGFSWNDPEISIEWPEEPVIISERDANLKPLT
ncbi:MAG: dTDP-4-dehydrorhamnose 3,5-epimerase [Sneathiella sp.]